MLATKDVSTKVSSLIDLQRQLFRECQATSGPISQLAGWMLDRRNLEAAWDRVRKSDGANTPGVDGETCTQINPSASNWLNRLIEDLLQDRYRPQEPRWIDIPKPNKPGQFRTLGILTIRDRVVCAALKQVLEPIFEPHFLDTSYGFRPGRSVPLALNHAAELLSAPPGQTPVYLYAAHLDVADCFDTIDHRLLQADLTRRISDPKVLKILDRLMVAGGKTISRWWWTRNCGLVQGSALSPLLCNVALHPVDLGIQQLHQHTQGGVTCLRYADDLLLLARDASIAAKGLQAIKSILRQQNQSLRDPNQVAKPIDQGVDWLGVWLKPKPVSWSTRSRIVYVIPDAKVASMFSRLDEMTAPPSEKIDASAFNLSRWLVSLNEQLRDWREAYQFADNADEVFQAIDEHVDNRVRELLIAVQGIRPSEVFRRHRLKLPRGFITWQVDGTRLVVLSSLAPHRANRLVRKPAWMQRPKSES